MEASENVVKSKDIETQSLHMTPIANIRAELKLFNAVFYLDRTPLKSLILDPINYIEPTIPNRIPKFHYTGHVSSYYNLNHFQWLCLINQIHLFFFDA